MKDEKKRVIVNFKNPEGEMKLTVRGANSVNNAIKIMNAFDEACTEIGEEDRKIKISRNVEE